MACDSAAEEGDGSATPIPAEFPPQTGRGLRVCQQLVPSEVGGEEFYLDLLFYHLKLRCYMIIELKTGAIKPEYADKPNLYLSAVDDLLRRPDDRSIIGLILCKFQNRLVAEYTQRDVHKPMGAATYRLGQTLPKEFRESLPTIKELKKRLAERKGKGRRSEGNDLYHHAHGNGLLASVGVERQGIDKLVP